MNGVLRREEEEEERCDAAERAGGGDTEGVRGWIMMDHSIMMLYPPPVPPLFLSFVPGLGQSKLPSQDKI